MHWKYALRFGTAAAAAILLSARANAANAATTTVIEAIDFERHADAVLVHYHLADGYDAADVRVGRAGKVVRIVLPDARLRGSKKKWPRPVDRFVKGSFAYQLTPTTVRHKLRLASGVDAGDISVRRFGGVIVARIPKRVAGKAVAMAPKDDPSAAAATPASATAAEAGPAAPPAPAAPTLAPIPLTTAASLDVPAPPTAALADAKPKAAKDTGRERLMRELFSTPGDDPAAAGDDPISAELAKAEPAAASADPLGELGADLPDVNPVTWLLIMAALALLLFAVKRKSRFAGLARASEGRTITVLDRKTVVGKTGVALLEAAGRLVLVGTSENGLTALADLGPSDEDFQSVVARTSTPTPAPLPPSAILDEPEPAPERATEEHTPKPAAHTSGVPAIAAVDAFRAKVAALRSA